MKGRIVMLSLTETPNFNKERYQELLDLKRTLRHPHILSLFSAFDHYQIVEYAPYGNLAQFPAISEAHLRHVLPMVTDALSYIHCRGYVHLGLRPKHIHVTDGFRVKLGGLDSARRIQRRYQSGSGNQLHSSPEDELHRPESDSWYLGCLCISLIAPESGTSDLTSWKLLLPESTSAALVDLVDCLLRSDPNQRMPIPLVHSHPFFAPALPIASLEDLYSHSPHFQTRKRWHGRTRDLFASQRPSYQRGVKRATSPGRRQLNGYEFPPEQLNLAEAIQEALVTRPLEPRSMVSPFKITDTSSATYNKYPLVIAGSLPPQTLTLSHGTIDLLRSGEIIIDFRERERLKGRKGGIVLLVNPDGLTVTLFRASQPTTPPLLKEPISTFLVKDIPTECRSVYTFAARYLDMVKRRTPMLTVSSGQLRYSLMSNLPRPDIELTFSNKERTAGDLSQTTRIRLSRSEGTLEIAQYRPISAKSKSIYAPSVRAHQKGKHSTIHVGEWKKRVLPLLPDGTMDIDLIHQEEFELITRLKDFVEFVKDIQVSLNQSRLFCSIDKLWSTETIPTHLSGVVTSSENASDHLEDKSTQDERIVKSTHRKPHLMGLGLPPRPRRFSVTATPRRQEAI
ncbi:SubName: Full=Uncharacterized protein {ECO:0000313/EMBL:CCA68458.1} [Serendipita indica DSM 11827]|nr:SubName: Full=Uncharacterized protein {ECO:0000313/EMBL:CCA68458.1} [Serendipita indica DSM 11827]